MVEEKEIRIVAARTPTHLAHLVELIDAHYSSVCEHHRSSLQSLLAAINVRSYRSCETNTGGAPARGGDGEGGNVQYASQQLTLGRGGISNHHQIDVTAKVRAVF